MLILCLNHGNKNGLVKQFALYIQYVRVPFYILINKIWHFIADENTSLLR